MLRGLASKADIIDVVAAFCAAVVITAYVAGTMLGHEPQTELITMIVTAAVAVLFGNYLKKRRQA